MPRKEPTEEALAKLPKWAQRYIHVLTRDLDEAETLLKGAKGRNYVTLGLGQSTHRFPDHSEAVFEVTNKRGRKNEIEIRREHDGDGWSDRIRVQTGGGGSLRIFPVAGNGIIVELGE